MSENHLAVLISEFIQATPPEIIQSVLQAVQGWASAPSEYQKVRILSTIHSPQTKSKLAKLLDCWILEFPSLSSECISLSIQSALLTSQNSRQPLLELIWTGPEGFSTNFRRTDQALLELINGAKENLLIVSFAVYKAKPIIKAVENAILRNVKVVICLEDADESHGKLSVSGVKAFSSSIFRLASFYTWPIENRLHAADGKFGSLHAKLAVADGEKVFISSANLTDYAMDLNMEMGVLVKDEQIGRQIDNLFTDLINNSVLQPILTNST